MTQVRHTRGAYAIVGTAVLLLAVSAVQANTAVLEYSFPTSYQAPDIVDVSGAGHTGNFDGTLSMSNSVPTGAAAGTQSVVTTNGAIVTNGGAGDVLLSNAVVAEAGGFQYHVAFNWDGTTTNWGVQKIVDYAGTESLQIAPNGGSAQLQFAFQPDEPTGQVTAVSMTIQPNTWYDVTATFDTQGNAVDGNGNLSGIASLVVNGAAPITAAATKGALGDSYIRPIGIGELGSHWGFLVNFKGKIYDPSVSLVPEPTTLSLLALAGLPLVRRRRA